MKTIVIGDVHGCHKELKFMVKKLIKTGKFNPHEDRLIFLGDYIDRGDNPRLAVKYVKSLQKKYGGNIIPLIGNHEQMMLDYFENGYSGWLYNGFESTIESYENNIELFKDMEWMKKLPFYYEDENFIYAHAGVDRDKPIDKQNNDTLIWTRDFFHEKIHSKTEIKKTIIFGHTPTSLINFYENDKPAFINNNVGIDTGCVFGGNLTALIIEDDKAVEYCQVKRNSKKLIQTKINN